MNLGVAMMTSFRGDGVQLAVEEVGYVDGVFLLIDGDGGGAG